MSTLVITPPTGPIRATVSLPRSKSISNRALVMASLSGDPDMVTGLSDGDDTRVLLRLLRDRPRVMHCGAGGTTFRFLLAWASVQEGEEHIITGTPRLLERPHDGLVDALRALGAAIDQVPEGFRVRGRRMPGGEVRFDSPISSQYISALLMVAPCMEQGLRLRWTGTRLSEPFVHMTLRMLVHFGVSPVTESDGLYVPPGGHVPAPLTVPPDWSAAAFWYELVAVSPGAEVLLEGLGDDGLQGDREASRLWSPWVGTTFMDEGAGLGSPVTMDPRARVPGRYLDLKHVPDLFQPLAFTFAALGQGVEFVGVQNLAVKETDRLQAVHRALAMLGRTSTIVQGTFALSAAQGPLSRSNVPFDPSLDHRMAMSLAPLSVVLGSIAIRDPGVVDKSYPAFWDHLAQAGFTLDHRS